MDFITPENIGNMVKAARIKEGYSQKDLEGIIAQSRLSRFENNQCTISSTDLLQILDAIHVSPKTFFFNTKNNYFSDIQTAIIVAGSADDLARLAALKSEVEDAKNESSPTQQQLLLALIEVFEARILPDKKMLKNNFLLNYFSEFRYPHSFDLVIFNNTLIALPEATILKWFELFIRELQNPANPFNRTIVKMIIQNIILTFLAEGKNEIAQQCNDEFKAIAGSHGELSIFINVKIIDAILLFRSGDTVAATNQINKTIDIVESLEATNFDYLEDFCHLIITTEVLAQNRKNPNYTAYHDHVGLISLVNF
ncbi:MAG: helix-turn-helix transcriptional regulator [Lactobacillales bacterium]|jgi:transcriptional regulator with XRE-family HTH domain|nr:helix-turn-helix transcriptional regulator [Lactobacillales bacterium]